MFESIAIGTIGHRNDSIDIGQLAECLMFYDKVRVITSAASFKSLVRLCGADDLLRLCDMGCLQIEFLDNMTMIASVETNVGTCHDMGMVSATVIKFPQIARIVADEEYGGSGGKSHRLFNKLNKTIKRIEYTGEIIQGSQAALTNETYLRNSAKRVLASIVPEYKIPDDLMFMPQKVPNFGVRYDTNIDFKAVTSLLEQRTGAKGEQITPAYLLAAITSAEPDILIASRNSSEIAVNPLKCSIVSERFNDLIAKSSGSKEQIELFSEVAIDEARSIREAINGGQRTFKELIPLIEQAAKFRSWVRGVQDDANLRNEYCKEISRIDWADKLPPKSLRFAVVTGASVIAGLALTPPVGALVGVGLGATDYFLLDRLVKGWKPNQFIEGPLKTFLK